MKTILRAGALCLLFASSAPALTGERFPEIPLGKMTPAQRAVADAIISGPRQRMSGPFNAWLRSPELADRLQKVGEYVRFHTSLDKRLNEMAIKAGLDSTAIAAIGGGRKPDNLKEDEAVA